MEVHFQEEILMDILNRLHVQSLLRFKCVSNFWKTLISGPYFKMKHLKHAKNDENFQKFLICQLCPEDGIYSVYCCPLTLVQRAEDVRKLDCPSDSKLWYCSISCCYDGLAIIEVCDSTVDKHHILVLWNPSTGESIVLPDPEFPPKGVACLGLGYDSTSRDYKIFKVDEKKENGRKVPSEILALKSGSWRKIDKHPRDIRNELFGTHSLAFVHGAFHWVGISRNYFVVSFNISNEVYREIPLPEQIFLLNIGVSILEEMLCVYSTYDFLWENTFKLWVLKDYGGNKYWDALFTVGDPRIYKVVPKYRFADGEVQFWSMGFDGQSFRTSRGPFGLWPRADSFQKGFAFTESLISLKLLT
ncbi:F-box protein CPR1-like isoform X2 [Nicotiana tomentosiformis]|nr:F-box protein CPR1-like isoform X2 [Nicotiana tomentosiformis]XP_033509171.1 F-box protein CPR1-like isoform X2 [Nicotiana tomentosiformis]